jgi:hypothetical protein
VLSGRLDKENIAELEALISAECKDRRIILDLKDMTLTGQDGVNFLARRPSENGREAPPRMEAEKRPLRRPLRLTLQLAVLFVCSIYLNALVLRLLLLISICFGEQHTGLISSK